jgi:hypothetical protein
MIKPYSYLQVMPKAWPDFHFEERRVVFVPKGRASDWGEVMPI